MIARDSADGLRAAYDADSLADVYVKAMASHPLPADAHGVVGVPEDAHAVGGGACGTRTRSEYFEDVDVARSSVVLRIVTNDPVPILRCT